MKLESLKSAWDRLVSKIAALVWPAPKSSHPVIRQLKCAGGGFSAFGGCASTGGGFAAFAQSTSAFGGGGFGTPSQSSSAFGGGGFAQSGSAFGGGGFGAAAGGFGAMAQTGETCVSEMTMQKGHCNKKLLYSCRFVNRIFWASKGAVHQIEL